MLKYTGHTPKPMQPCAQCFGMFKAKGTVSRFCSHPCWITYKTLNGLGNRTKALDSAVSSANISRAQKKRFETQPVWNKGLIGYRSGEVHHNWKGGVSPQDKADRQFFAQQIRSQIFARDNYTCQVCQEYGGRLHVDHIVQWKDDPELRFEPSNCRTLCVPCHYYVTFKRKMPSTSKWGLRSGVES